MMKRKTIALGLILYLCLCLALISVHGKSLKRTTLYEKSRNKRSSDLLEQLKKWTLTTTPNPPFDSISGLNHHHNGVREVTNAEKWNKAKELYLELLDSENASAETDMSGELLPVEETILEETFTPKDLEELIIYLQSQLDKEAEDEKDKRGLDTLGGMSYYKRGLDTLGNMGFHNFKKRSIDTLGNMGFHDFKKRGLDTLGNMGFHDFKKRGLDTIGTWDFMILRKGDLIH